MNNKSYSLIATLVLSALASCGKSIDNGTIASGSGTTTPNCPQSLQMTYQFQQPESGAESKIAFSPDQIAEVTQVSVDGKSVAFHFNAEKYSIELSKEAAGNPGSLIEAQTCLTPPNPSTLPSGVAPVAAPTEKPTSAPIPLKPNPDQDQKPCPKPSPNSN
jgi:hypothetical protein